MLISSPVILYTEMNIFAIAIVMLILLTGYRKQHTQQDEKIFDLLLVSMVIVLLADTIMWILDGRTFSGASTLYAIFTNIYYFAQMFIPFLWLMYCGVKIYGSVGKKQAAVYMLPMLFAFAVLMLNWHLGIIYTIDGANIYHRGSRFFIFVFIALFYMLCAMFISYRAAARVSKARRGEFVYLAMFPIAPFVGCILQGIFYGLSLIWLCTVFSLLMIYINVQSDLISTDDLTHMNNRRKLNRFVAHAVYSLAVSERIFCIVVDMDNFKTINDTYGHDEGDRALIRAAELLKRVCDGEHCFLARVGGDEFCIIYTCGKNSDASDFLRKLREAEASEDSSSGFPYHLHLSIGCAEFERGADTIDTWFSHADALMYADKKAKKSDAVM